MQVCAAAAAWNADVIVMGTHGRTGLEHILLGSTVERVLTMAPCPVLTVREANGSEGKPVHIPIRFKHITIPIDFSECSAGALEYGIQMVKDFNASLTLLPVLEPVFYGDDFTLPQAMERSRLDERLDTQFKTSVSTIESAGFLARRVIRGGVPADSILEFVRASACDLIVMGTHGRRGISRVLQGSVAEAVLRLASCPLPRPRREEVPPLVRVVTGSHWILGPATLQRPFDLAAGLAGFNGVAAVIQFLALGESQFDLGEAALGEVNPKRDEGEASLRV